MGAPKYAYPAPAQAYPAPAQGYPAQAYPAPAQGYPAQGYPAPAQGYYTGPYHQPTGVTAPLLYPPPPVPVQPKPKKTFRDFFQGLMDGLKAFFLCQDHLSNVDPSFLPLN